MPVTNDSFLTTAELYNLEEKAYIYQLLAQENSEVETDLSQALSAEQQDRLHTFMNLGRERIENGLREVYDISGVTQVNAPLTLKELNAAYAIYYLEKRRVRGGGALTTTLEELELQVSKLARDTTLWQLPIDRKSGACVTHPFSKKTRFDEAGLFDGIIPESDADVDYPGE